MNTPRSPYMVRVVSWILACAAPMVTGCIGVEQGPALDDDTDSESALGPRYIELGDFVSSDADIERWLEIRLGLEDAFDDVCGDTFCEGDYTNLQSLGFTCSVSPKQGRLRECVWTFAASDEAVDAATGSIASNVPFYECRFRPSGRVPGFLEAFGDDPLQSPLPGLGGSLYDALGECFNNPLHQTQLPEPTEGPYRNASDVLEDTEYDAWYEMVFALRSEFDQVCGDSFCEGEYTNLEPLRFKCSENTVTGELGTCAWTFAGSEEVLRYNGSFRIEAQPYTCSFAVDATAAELSAALAPSDDGVRLFDRPLPNTTTTLNDVLIDCL